MKEPMPTCLPGRLVCDRLRSGYWVVRVQTPMGLSPVNDLEYKTYTEALHALQEMESKR